MVPLYVSSLDNQLESPLTVLQAKPTKATKGGKAASTSVSRSGSVNNKSKGRKR